jgi:hypothetical protein
LPKGLTTINFGVFLECYALKNITIPDCVTIIGDSAFRYCVALENIVIPDGVTSIGFSTFMKCDSLSSITIPDSVTSIGTAAFSYCFSLTDITFLGLTPPATGSNWVKNTSQNLRGHAYSYASFPAPGESFNGLTMGDYFHYNYTISNGQATITRYLNRSSIDVTIPGSVTSIGNDAFSTCTSLGSVTLSNGLASIGNAAFMQCFSLPGLTIPDSVISIGEAAFQGCTSLTDITIPYSVTGIGNAAFLLCSSTANGFILSSSKLGKGEIAIKLSVCDNVGNIISAKYDIKIK